MRAAPRTACPAPSFVSTLAITGASIVALMATACAPSPDRPRGPTEAASVRRVIDGDTISVSRGGHDVTIRLIGIDTPETKRPDTAVECFGPQAHAHLASLLPPGTAVQLEHDVERKDRYDRELAYVHRGADGLFVNRAMVTDGFAAVLVFPPNTRHEPGLSDAVADARLTRRGLWAACGSPHRPAS